jgi:hypothetical protein
MFSDAGAAKRGQGPTGFRWSQRRYTRAHTTIALGDLEGLKRALSTLGVTDEGLKKLEADIKADETNGQPSIGPRIKGWLANIGQYLGKEGAKAGIDVAKKLATKWILQHYGMDLD